MKKLLVLTVAGLFLSLSVICQINIEFGIKGGATLSRLKNKIEKSDIQTGYDFGVFSRFRIGNKISMQPEVSYARQGPKFKYLTDRLDYINFPVLFQYQIKNRLRLQSGPQLGILTSSKRTLLHPAIESFPGDYKKFDGSWVFGAEYILSKKAGFEVRYNYGFTNMQNDLEGFFRRVNKNRVWQFNFNYTLMGKR